VKQKKTPQRTCIGCRTVKPKRELIRIVRTPEGNISIDRSGKINGRGAYVCVKDSCVDTAIISKRMSKALDIEIDEATAKSIKEELCRIVSNEE
jgi:predicted RNA-binding protein YlxR (DUF448 family)